ncbi:MAG TPA: ribosome biogenesis GTPase Der [Opitutaceae bacterium]|nr:ribosome biogenesis GTPase Der [Opitutaceae bacterium]
MFRSVVIVGRPNVGKSRLFNRLARKRISIVHDQPGVTRDVISAEVGDGYTLMDTGGLGLREGESSSAAIIEASEKQIGFAIDTASLILFVVDGLERVTALDDRIAARLRRGGKPVIVVVNKADFGDEKADLEGVARLGLGEPVCVSAEHGRGESELREAILDRIGRRPEAPPADPADAGPGDQGGNRPICISFIGRPNVGKSSLANWLLKSNRLIVDERAGTTRDAVELPFDFKGRDRKLHSFRLIDTAGIKAATKVASSVEYFSRLRSLDAMQRSDVVFLVLDALDGVTQQDKAIAGEAVKDRKPIAIVVNKWDLVHEAFRRDGGIQGAKSERDYREKYEKALFDRLFFTPGAPLIFVSALSGYEVDRMMNAAVRLYRTMDKKLPTSRLNETLARLAERTPPPAIGARRFRIYYATQTGNRPFRIRVFCNREERLSEGYRRYLEAGLVGEFGLNGCPVEFELVGKPRGDGGR